MFLEMVDALRCPRGHQDSLLVAAADRTEGRDIVTGVLGCPECRAEFPVIEGVAHFEVERAPVRGRAVVPSMDRATRLAAFLALTDPAGYVVLIGEWGCHARLLQSLTEHHLVLVNAPDGIASGDGVSLMVTGTVLPLASGGARALAFDRRVGEGQADSAIRAVRPGGRILGPLAVTRPAGTTEITRDAELWIAERDGAAPAVVGLTRRRP